MCVCVCKHYCSAQAYSLSSRPACTYQLESNPGPGPQKYLTPCPSPQARIKAQVFVPGPAFMFQAQADAEAQATNFSYDNWQTVQQGSSPMTAPFTNDSGTDPTTQLPFHSLMTTWHIRILPLTYVFIILPYWVMSSQF